MIPGLVHLVYKNSVLTVVLVRFVNPKYRVVHVKTYITMFVLVFLNLIPPVIGYVALVDLPPSLSIM